MCTKNIIYVNQKKEVKKMAGRGRPPAKEPKTVEVKIRITDTEAKMLDYCIAETKMNKSDIMRRGLKKVYDETFNNKYKKK